MYYRVLCARLFRFRLVYNYLLNILPSRSWHNGDNIFSEVTHLFLICDTMQFHFDVAINNGWIYFRFAFVKQMLVLLKRITFFQFIHAFSVV